MLKILSSVPCHKPCLLARQALGDVGGGVDGQVWPVVAHVVDQADGSVTARVQSVCSVRQLLERRMNSFNK